jgi:flavin-dependent dehydrogenase
MSQDYNVIILGGGLAGLTLARQIKQREPAISIAVLELRKNEAPVAAHKVGESTVELGTHYLREVLGLSDYLEKNHLHKHGLRFFFPHKNNESILERVEYGARKELYVPSHQIDRGVIENDLVKMNLADGIDIILGAKVSTIDFSDEGHSVTFTKEGELKTLTASWVVDATGRLNLIKRKENLLKDNEHNINSVWFRVEGEFDMQKWTTDSSWKGQVPEGLRRLGTVHFMGKGYWLWFIPLSSGYTSIGIVADPRFHAFDDINTLDKAYDWIKINEPLAFEKLDRANNKVLDFKRFKNYSYDSKQFYSTDKWGVVGEAGAFLDPFYSPGTDFIAMSNTWVSDLIVRDFNEEDIYTRTIVYDQVHAQFFNNWKPIYVNKYALFGNAQVMAVKITWDFGVYWGIPCLLATNRGFTNMDVLKMIFTVKDSFGERFGKLNKQVQDFYLEWGELEDVSHSNAYLDPMDVSFIKDLQIGLEVIHDSDELLVTQLEKNLSTLEKIAAEMFRTVSAKLKGTPDNMAVDPYVMSLKESKEELIKQSQLSNAIVFDKEVKKQLSALWI